jgi:multicomponent Na+:H+ antiporter subunit G
MTVADFVVHALVLVGVALTLLASVGLVRMPDLYTRLQASSKASTLGAGCALLATAVQFPEASVEVRAALVILFLFATTPIAAHMIARVGYLTGVPRSRDTRTDELEGRYDKETHSLASDDAARPEAGRPD